MTFEPIAIIGQSCLFPGAHNTEMLWENILAQKNTLAPASANEWRVNPRLLTQKNNRSGDYIATDVCGSVQGFDQLFNPEGFYVSADQVQSQDQICKWLVHAGREALQQAAMDVQKIAELRAGCIFGNLSYPTPEMNRYIEAIWLAEQSFQQFKGSADLNHPQHRFMSGYPALFMAKALGLTAKSFTLDAACASSLYAIELACRELQQNKADMMLAGGINLTDGLFLNLGFTALQALSPTGQSRPLHNEANGLIPSQGVGLFVLKRLTDALADKDKILGVVRAVGLSNDGRSRGFLVPDQNGQVTAMQKAYQQSGIFPEEISWIECHATGTTVGDAIEINSMQQIFKDVEQVSIGALKANIGHSITASGAAALSKVLHAFAAETKPPTLYADEQLNAALTNTPFKVSDNAEAWQVKDKCVAAVNCFGFGGNNAHLLVEKWQAKQLPTFKSTKNTNQEKIAIVGVDIIAANSKNRTDFMHAWLNKTSAITEYRPGFLGGYLDQVELSLDEAHFPPTELKRAVGGQLAILKVAHQAMASNKPSDTAKAAAWIGMQCDSEIARSGFGCRLTEYFPTADDQWLQQARASIRPALESADVIGAMPNIVTNRLNAEFDFKGPSYSVSAEEGSGLVALDLAVQHLKDGSVDYALAGAVDICCEIGHRAAASNVLKTERQIPSDAAVVLVLKRLADAKKDGDTVYATICDQDNSAVSLTLENSRITSNFGHAHAASGLLHVAAAALLVNEKDEVQEKMLGTAIKQNKVINISVDALGGQNFSVYLEQN
jgi:acyl transferase domain-containing protein